MSESYLKWFIFVGNAATFAMAVLVVHFAGGWGLVIWVPLQLLIEFGCFAERDRDHLKKKQPGAGLEHSQ